MRIRNIIAGVDSSREGMWAAAVAWRLARESEADCRFIHATFDTKTLAAIPPSIDFDAYVAGIDHGAREELAEAMWGNVPEAAVEALEVLVGKPALVLRDAAAEGHADMIVLGGRRRSAASRWLEGGILKYLMRSGDIPVLCAVPAGLTHQRILIAVDRSSMMEPTIRWGRCVADLYGATVRLIHVVEPLPYDYAASVHQPDEFLGWARMEFEDQLSEIKGTRGLDRNVVHGPVVRSISHEVRRWNADLLVLGSHGKGLVDRVLLGSTTTRLANELPASLLVVPITERVGSVQKPRTMEGVAV